MIFIPKNTFNIATGCSISRFNTYWTEAT